MTIADNARNQAISLEAKKDALTQRQSGDWKISFTVQGIDMDPRLTQAAMGTRFAMVLVEIGDDELPVQKEARAEPRQARQPQPDGVKRMDWREVQPAAQAGIRCADPTFRAFLMEECEYRPRDQNDAEEAAVFIRDYFGVKSRSEFGTDHRKRVLWKQFDDQFQAWKAVEHA
jgi:hypothetical protein